MGKIVETIKLDAKPFLVFGRLPTCDVPMEHPSLSRFHAVLQYRSESRLLTSLSCIVHHLCHLFHPFSTSIRATDESPEAAEDKKKGFYLIDLGR